MSKTACFHRITFKLWIARATLDLVVRISVHIDAMALSLHSHQRDSRNDTGWRRYSLVCSWIADD